MEPRRSLAIAGLTAGLTLLAVSLALAGSRLAPAPMHTPWASALPFLLLLAASGYFIVQYRYRNEANAIDLFEAALTPVIVAFPVAAVVLLAASGQAIAEALRRNHPRKAAFNVAALSLSACAGALVFRAAGGDAPLEVEDLRALVPAMFVVTLVNQVAFVTVVRIARAEPLRAVLSGLAPVILPGWVAGWTVNLVFGLLFALAYDWSPWTVPFDLVPLAALHLGSRGYAAALADRTRLEQASDAIAELVAPMNPREAVPGFLERVRECFGADTVDLVLVNGEALEHYRLRAAGGVERSQRRPWEGPSLAARLLASSATVLVTPRGPDPALAGLLRAEGWRDCIAAPLDDGERITGVLCVYNRSGPEGFEDGELAVLQSLARELAHALHKAELIEAILGERRRLGDIVKSSSDGICAFDASGKIVSWNPAMERITGLALERTRGVVISTILPCADEDGRPLDLLKSLPHEGHPALVQFAAGNASPRWLAVTRSRLSDGGCVLVVRDETARKQVENMKSDFLATVSHELRTPLTPIKGFLETVLRRGADLPRDQVEEFHRLMLHQTERLERLINDLLAATAPAPARRTVSIPDEIDWPGTASRVVALAQAREDWRHLIVLDTPPEGAPTVEADGQQAEQVLENLLSNACKYSPEGSNVRVVIGCAPGEVVTTVIDEGPGIAPADREHIFERFTRLGHSTTRPVGGAGLGLFIARELVSAMGGRIWVESSPDGGSAFSFSLPVSRHATRPTGNVTAREQDALAS